MRKFRMSAAPSLRRTLASLMPMIAGKGLGLFVGSFVLVALLELAAVGMLPAFIAALADPRAYAGRAGLQIFAPLAGADDAQFIAMLGAALAGFFVVKNLVIAAVTHFQSVFVARRQAALSTRLVSVYLRQPYPYHLQRHSTELVGNATGVAFNVFAGVVLPASVALTEALVTALISALLLVVNPLATLLAVGVTGGVSLALYGFFRARLQRLGERQLAERAELNRWLTQAIGGIKETIILGREQFFVDNHARLVAALSRSNAVMQTVGTLPRLFVETAVICALVAVVAVLVRSGTRIETVFPSLALFGVAALRLMPSATRIVGALTMIRFYQSSVDSLARDLAEGGARERPPLPASAPRFALSRQIEARALSYTYADAAVPALHDVSLRIDRGSMVAFVGRSGAGKSTLVDILIGLHSPTSGQVLVDGRDIAADVRSWQRSIGYVPQSIFLADDSLRRNVAFGLDDAEIDDEAVRRALEAAQLGDFVRSLPRGVETKVGERGSRISGGQRQRLGIARALYGDPDVLVLDEPTTALDLPTAQEVGTVLSSLAGRKTVLLIAHQMSSVRLCHRVFLLRDGALVAEGSYADLASAYPEFQSLLE